MSPHERLILNPFEYRGFHGCQSFCKVEVIPVADGRTVVIATELADNPGTSVTNVAEYLASEICGRFSIQPDRLAWIETYGYPAPGERQRTFDRVTFERRPRSELPPPPSILRLRPSGWPGQFCRPLWRAMRDADWAALGMGPPAQVF